MAELKLYYTEPIPMQSVGNEIDPRVALNIASAVAQGVRYERIKRLDSGAESTLYERPIPWTVQLDVPRMQQILQIIFGAAVEQGERPSIPDLVVPPPPPPPPPPVVVVVEVVPPATSVGVNGTVQLSANVVGVPDGGTVAVDWFMAQGHLGTVDANGLYTAPATPGVYRVVARSRQDAAATAVCVVTVV